MTYFRGKRKRVKSSIRIANFFSLFFDLSIFLFFLSIQFQEHELGTVFDEQFAISSLHCGPPDMGSSSFDGDDASQLPQMPLHCFVSDENQIIDRQVIFCFCLFAPRVKKRQILRRPGFPEGVDSALGSLPCGSRIGRFIPDGIRYD